MKLLLLFGVQGSGKGTQAKLIAQKHNYSIFEPGAKCREIAKLDTPLGIEIKETINSGKLVSSSHIKKLIETFLSETQNQKIIFDGYPRNQEQYETFLEIVKEHNLEYKGINFELSKEEAIKRLIKRAEIENRADDTPEVIEKRISIFYEDTLPIVKELENQNKITIINADDTIENIQDSINNKIEL